MSDDQQAPQNDQPPQSGQQPYGQQQYDQSTPPQYGQQQYDQSTPPQYGQQQYDQPTPPQYDQQPYGPPQPGYGYAPQAYAPVQPRNADGSIPLWAPHYGIGFVDAVKRVFQKYARFDGRASRGEYWWWALADGIVVAVLYTLVIVLGVASGIPDGYGGSSFGPLAILPGAVLFIWIVATIVPSLAVAWRRLHDANFAGPFWFLSLIPSVGGIILLVFTVMGSKPEGARFDQPERG
jgi:uncharacterized membrane protein YhaH (DUF805 family)